MTEIEDWAVLVPLGYRVAGWEVVRPIATGSWGSVYEGRWSVAGPDMDVPERVALKFLPTGTLTTRQVNYLADMAARELSLHSALSHPRLIGFYEALTVDDEHSPRLDGAVVLVMELATESVAELLDTASFRPLANAPRLIVEMCEGLAHMHDNGWIHGDLKPRNILVMADGSLRLTDFGLAIELEGTHGYLPPAGSSDYMPPERWDEPLTDRGTAIRTGSDIWALGITAYQVLTGRFPFPGGTARARMAAATEYVSGRRELPLPEALPTGWREWLADCLAPDTVARPTAKRPVGSCPDARHRPGGPSGAAAEAASPPNGRYLCQLAPEVVNYTTDPLQRQLLAAVIFQSNTKDMRRVKGVPDYARWYADKVKQYLPLYLPKDGRLPPPRANSFTPVPGAGSFTPAPTAG